MENSTQAVVKEFILLGLSDDSGPQVVLVLVFFLMYMVTLSGNALLVVIVRLNYHLQTPMYFFLSNLSVIDICFSSTVVPKLLLNTLSRMRSISFLGCAAQLFFHLALGVIECMILTVMAFDRYIAICKPLQYNSIMNKRLCMQLATISWVVGLVNSTIHTVLTFRLPFCRSNLIDHFLCEVPPLLRLSCRDVWVNELAEYIAAGIIAMGSFFLILTSYFCITLTLLGIKSVKERIKAFSTCASHIAVVLLYYGAIMIMHLRPRSSYSPEQDRGFSVIYSVVTPMLNPIIYSMRNKDIKGGLRKNRDSPGKTATVGNYGETSVSSEIVVWWVPPYGSNQGVKSDSEGAEKSALCIPLAVTQRSQE
ncbi:olfactory receptor 2G3-like [Dendropsophus ebraccatus]|uniref:olfactory receptor 2G3-like n=1 Tax=Dendropsophus ebraccatus TaxID=150705 RepID=UPI003831A983